MLNEKRGSEALRGLEVGNNAELEKLNVRLNSELARVREMVEAQGVEDTEDFNLRGDLYAFSAEIAPESRNQDLEYLHEWIKPQEGEIAVDIAAGSGFLTKNVSKWTKGKVYAIDPSEMQLNNLRKKISEDDDIEVIEGSLSKFETMEEIGDDIGKVDFVTSYGGIHHVMDENREDKQKAMFKNIEKILKPGGRFVAGDIGNDTTLADHFVKWVKTKGLTGHTEKLLSPERLEELVEGTSLKVKRAEIVPVEWVYDSEKQLAMFIKALNAFDMSEEEVLQGLKDHLGYKKKGDKVHLNWPMLFFDIRKES